MEVKPSNPKEDRMVRGQFNRDLITGLFKIRNRGSEQRRYETRQWLRQCIRLERQRREVVGS